MAQATAKYASANDILTGTPATNWVDVCAINASEFEASKKYLILVSAYSNISSSANEVRMRLLHGATEFDEGSLAYEVLIDAQYTNFGWLYVFDQPATPETITLQLSSASTQPSNCETASIFALKLSDDFTEGADWHYDEDTTDVANYSSTTPATIAGITFTPNGTDTYLLIGQATVRGLSTADSYAVDLRHDTGAATLVKLNIEGEDATNEKRGHLMMAAVTPSASSQTYSLRYYADEAGGNVAIFRGSLFALRLNKFSRSGTAVNPNSVTPAASPSWTQALTLNPSATTGDYFYYGYATYVPADITNSLAMRLQVNPDGESAQTYPSGYDETAPTQDGWDNTDLLPENHFALVPITAGSGQAALEVSALAGTTLAVKERSLIAFSLELAGGAPPAGQPMQLRALNVPHFRQWQPRGLRGSF